MLGSLIAGTVGHVTDGRHCDAQCAKGQARCIIKWKTIHWKGRLSLTDFTFSVKKNSCSNNIVNLIFWILLQWPLSYSKLHRRYANLLSSPYFPLPLSYVTFFLIILVFSFCYLGFGNDAASYLQLVASCITIVMLCTELCLLVLSGYLSS